MKTRHSKLRQGRMEAEQRINKFTNKIRVQRLLQENGISSDDISPWNYDSGICYHKPTGRAIMDTWTEAKVKEFCTTIVSKPTL